jgi:hypothetical protein
MMKDLLSLTFPSLRDGPLPLPTGERKIFESERKEEI